MQLQNKTTFKSALMEIIEVRGIISIDNLEYICKKLNKKFDNGTRTLRKLIEEGKITTKRNEKGVIIAYIYIIPEQISVPRAQHELQQELFKAKRLF